MANKITKTNAARLLDAADVEYELVPHKVDVNDLSAHNVAREMGVDVDQLFKTLVMQGETSGVIVCVVAGGYEVDLKKAAAVSGNKKVAMLHLKELQSTTGYIRGGCSPIAMKRDFPLYIDEKCEEFDFIFINAGARGLQIKISPTDFVKFSGATVESLTRQ